MALEVSLVRLACRLGGEPWEAGLSEQDVEQWKAAWVARWGGGPLAEEWKA